jgi:hypothetical protein
MRKIVTHKSCDIDAISSVWLLKRFYPNWDGAQVEFVNAGEKLTGNYTLSGHPEHSEGSPQPIEIVDGVETIHVDTGMGALDHHQTSDMNTCGAKKTLDFILSEPLSGLHSHEIKKEAVGRIVELVIDDDHFQEVYYPDANQDIYEFGIVAIIQGYKLLYQKDDVKLMEFIFECLDSVLQNFEKKIWAEREIKEKGVEFESKWGKALAIESINDEVLKTAQMAGFVLTVRKDTNGGFVRIKAMPDKRQPVSSVTASEARQSHEIASSQAPRNDSLGIDLTEVYEKLKQMDPDATWFLHASKRMLLNGSTKNPEMKGTKLTLSQVVEVLKG